MTKQTINVGTSPNDRRGDSLRAAFQKVNANFTELYTALGLDVAPLNLGAFEFTGSTLSTTDSSSITIDQATTITSNLTVGGDILPSVANGGDLGSSARPWRSMYVSNQTIYLGGTPLSLDPNTNELKINNVPVSQTITYTDIPNVPTDVSDLTDDDGLLGGGGGGAGPVQPYLELTDTPFITQPVTLGTPVTVTVPVTGINAQVQVGISEGPVLGEITVITPGTGYVPGTTYKIYSYQIGGSNDATDSITFTIDTVNGFGGIMTVANAAFTGVATNNSGSYNVSIDYQPVQIFDEIRPGLTLTRDNVQGIYNSDVEPEYDNSTYLSPLGTEWNSDGWGDLTGIGARSYTTWRAALNNQVGNNIVASELVMHDIANDKYYKFDFASWGGSNGGYSYTRTEVTDPNYFKKDDYATANNVDVIEDDSTIQIGITRGENNGIYNPFTEEGWDEDVSPQGTEWNIDGWNDLTDVETRTYTNLYAAFGNGGLGNKIVGTECVMYVPSIEKYYAVKFLSWTQGDMGGGFSYTRKEIDLTKLNEGVKFPDGTVLKSALGTGRVKSTAAGNRRIEEVTGYNQVAVTARTTIGLTTVASRAGASTNLIWVDSTSTTIDEVINNSANYNFQFSLDNTTWYTWNGSTSFSGDERGYVVTTTLTYDQDDTVYFRYSTGADPVVWWDKADLPGGAGNFRGAVIDYHAYTGESTIIGTIHIVDDDGEEHISHQEVQSGSTDGENDDLWLVTTEGQIKYRRIDGESKTLKIHWTAKVFYGSELYD
jgi:hypothetical protein